MANPDKTKMDNVAKHIAKANEQIAKFQAKIAQIMADGVITDDEQIQLNEFERAITHFEDRIERFVPLESTQPK